MLFFLFCFLPYCLVACLISCNVTRSSSKLAIAFSVHPYLPSIACCSHLMRLGSLQLSYAPFHYLIHSSVVVCWLRCTFSTVLMHFCFCGWQVRESVFSGSPLVSLSVSSLLILLFLSRSSQTLTLGVQHPFFPSKKLYYFYQVLLLLYSFQLTMCSPFDYLVSVSRLENRPSHHSIVRTHKRTPTHSKYRRQMYLFLLLMHSIPHEAVTMLDNLIEVSCGVCPFLTTYCDLCVCFINLFLLSLYHTFSLIIYHTSYHTSYHRFISYQCDQRSEIWVII